MTPMAWRAERPPAGSARVSRTGLVMAMAYKVARAKKMRE